MIRSIEGQEEDRGQEGEGEVVVEQIIVRGYSIVEEGCIFGSLLGRQGNSKEDD